MSKLTFVRVTPEATVACELFREMMPSYIDELNEHSERPLPKQYQQRWIDSIISLQGAADRYLELCCQNGETVGFFYGKLDHVGDRGYIRPGWGYIMEFYVRPGHRRSGVGRAMLERLEQQLLRDGAERLYLTADPVTGKPFWEAMGFECSGERSPENQLYIYERAVRSSKKDIL